MHWSCKVCPAAIVIVSPEPLTLGRGCKDATININITSLMERHADKHKIIFC